MKKKLKAQNHTKQLYPKSPKNKNAKVKLSKLNKALSQFKKQLTMRTDLPPKTNPPKLPTSSKPPSKPVATISHFVLGFL